MPEIPQALDLATFTASAVPLNLRPADRISIYQYVNTNSSLHVFAGASGIFGRRARSISRGYLNSERSSQMLYGGMGLLMLSVVALILGFAAGMPGLAGVVSAALLIGLALCSAGALTLGHHRFHRWHMRR
jgi:hypothetical protein